jgi:hypothetical protein
MCRPPACSASTTTASASNLPRAPVGTRFQVQPRQRTLYYSMSVSNTPECPCAGAAVGALPPGSGLQLTASAPGPSTSRQRYLRGLWTTSATGGTG